MPGVIAEIDLVLNKASLERLRQDFDRATQQLGTGLAAGATPAAQNYAKQLVERLRTEFQQRSETLAKQLREGVLDVRQYNQAAERLGKEIVRDLNRGVKAGGSLQLFEGEGGIALRNQLEAIGASARRAQSDIVRLPAEVTKVGRAGAAAAPGLTTMRAGFVSLALQATKTSGPLGSITNGLLAFAGGGAVTLAVVAGLGLIAKAYELLTKKTREAAAETKAFFERLDAAIKERARREDPATAFFGDFRKIAAEIEKLERQLAAARRGSVVETAEGPVTFGPDPKRIARLEAELAKLGARSLEVGKQLREALDASKADALGSAVEKVTDKLGTAVQAVVSAGSLNEQVIAQGAEAAAEATRTAAELAAGAITNLTETWREQNSERLSQIAGQKSAEQQAIEEIEAANVDLHDLLAVQAEEDAARRKATQIEQLAHLEEQAYRVERIIDNVAGIASAWGLVDEATAQVLSTLGRMATDAVSLTKSIASGDVIGAIGSGVNILGGLGSLFGESPEAKALRESMEKNERAIRDLSENIKKLDLTMTGTQLLAAGRGLGSALGPEGSAQGVFPGIKGSSGVFPISKADPELLDRALRQAGSSLTELQDIANDLGIDIDELTRGQLTQLQRAIQEVDLTAFTRTLEGQLSVFQRFARQAGLTATETLTGIVGRARGTSEAFDKVFEGIDLSTREGLDEAHKRIVQALRDVPLLTAELLGDMSVEQYLALLDEAGGLVSQGLDDLGQAILDAAREAEEAAQEAADLSRRRIGSRRDINELLDRTDPLEIIKGIAGGVPKVLQDALSGLDLTREADRARLDARLQSLFAQLSTGQLERGGLLEGMAPEDFRGILLEWERLLDEERANEQQRAENEASEAEQRVRDRERAAEEARREAERLEREHQERERDRLQALTEAEQLQVDRRLAEEERAELLDLEKRARLLGGDPAEAIREALQLFAEAERLAGGELGAESPLARDARRRALEAQREAERQIEQGERLLGEVITPGFTVQRTITESSAGHLISELQLQTNWLQRMDAKLVLIESAIRGQRLSVNVSGNGLSASDVSRDLAAEFQRAALLSGNAEMR